MGLLPMLLAALSTIVRGMKLRPGAALLRRLRLFLRLSTRLVCRHRMTHHQSTSTRPRPSPTRRTRTRRLLPRRSNLLAVCPRIPVSMLQHHVPSPLRRLLPKGPVRSKVSALRLFARLT